MSHLKLYKTWTIRNPDGKIVFKKRTVCKSFVIAWLQLIETTIAHGNNTYSDAASIKDTGNTARSVTNNVNVVNYMAAEAPATTSTYGMQVGTGTTTPAVSDYKIETQIAHGTGSGQLSYGATSVSGARVEGTSSKLLIQRPFSNGSGGTVTIRESALVLVHTTNTWYFLVIHEAENQAVTNGQTATLTYDLTCAV